MSDVMNALTGRLRLRMMEKLQGWPRPEKTLRQVARETGISPATLSRFMAGRSVKSDVIDRLDSWLIHGGGGD